MIVALAQILLRSLRVNIHLLECPVVMDITFMIDVSGSIPWQDIADVKEMMKKVTSRFLFSSTGKQPFTCKLLTIVDLVLSNLI